MSASAETSAHTVRRTTLAAAIGAVAAPARTSTFSPTTTSLLAEADS